MAKAWHWYWSTIRQGWMRRDKRHRRIMGGVLLASAAFYGALLTVIIFAPGARVPVLLGVIILLPLQSIIAAVVRSRGKRGRSD